ncbi:MAG: protein kinase [Proteobacteria bacterium]|nr:protein kinase [Pseudomonadota bacterium]
MIAVGQSIGNYRILSKIGTGGMGAVFLAEHPLIGKRAAIKVIHRELAHNRDVVSRFFQEARAVNQIGNEHIVEIHDFGVTPEGDHFYIMEWLDGKTLASVMAESRSRAVEVMRALHIGAQIASALGAAHASGVIHRDLKPDNVMLIPRLGDPDFVKVLDFGLAKVFQTASAVQTAAGVLLGTPQYMSPEACESRGGIDHRTDIYALGVLLFQMMTGKLPFDGDTMGEVLVKQVTALPPAPRGLNAAIPPSVEQILLRCLAKRVDARFQSMGALRDALLAPYRYLGSAPPMQPARSVAPGEMGFDARALAQHVAGAASSVPHHQQRTTLGTLAAPTPHAVSQHMAAQPQPPSAPYPKMNTMRIATPLGYSSRPPRRVWPIVLVLGLVLGLGGGAAAVAWFGRGKRAVVAGPSRLDAGASTGSSSPAPTTADARGSANSTGSGSGGIIVVPIIDDAGIDAPVATTVRVTFESIPAGAEVFVGTQRLGLTPFDAEVAVSATAVAFEFRLAGYKRVTKPMTVSSSTSISVELERGSLTPKGTPHPPRPETGLMRPGAD